MTVFFVSSVKKFLNVMNALLTCEYSIPYLKIIRVEIENPLKDEEG